MKLAIEEVKTVFTVSFLNGSFEVESDNKKPTTTFLKRNVFEQITAIKFFEKTNEIDFYVNSPNNRGYLERKSSIKMKDLRGKTQSALFDIFKAYGTNLEENKTAIDKALSLICEK